MPNFIQIVFLILSVAVFGFVCFRFVSALIRRIKKKKADKAGSVIDEDTSEVKK